MALSALLAVFACVSVDKSALDDTSQANPVPRDQVQVYLPGDEVPELTRIAILTGKGDSEATDEGEMYDKLREDAGKLGANAIIIQATEEPGTGARVARAFLGTSANRTMQAIAVFVPSGGGSAASVRPLG